MKLQVTVLLRPNVHAMLHVTPIVHWARCSRPKVTRYRTGKCSLRAEVYWLVDQTAG